MAYSKVDSPPFWWHNHGGKVKVDVLSHRLVLEGGAAKLFITRAENRKGEYQVFWHIQHGDGPEHKSLGTVYFCELDLRMAFGDVDRMPKDETWQRYAAHSVSPGKFIRAGRYLNLPCPGTGHDGDPNMSIYVSDEIVRAVEKYTGLPLSSSSLQEVWASKG